MFFPPQTINDYLLNEILSLSVSLHTLDLNGCTSITMNGFKNLHCCPYLVSLNLSNCIQVSDDHLRTISKVCPQMKNLNLHKCDRFEYQKISNVSKQFNSYSEALKNSDADIVYISLPNSLK